MERKEREIFLKYLPEKSVDYCLELWQKHHIQFTISAPRRSVYGNYYCRKGIHHISVNGNLPPEAFLVTYLHEVAHLKVHLLSRKVAPHGREWQAAFRNLLLPLLKEEIFSNEVAHALRQHLENPRASSCTDPVLHGVLMKNDAENLGKVSLSDLTPGQTFLYENKLYALQEKRRTRFACISLADGRLFLFSSVVKVHLQEQEKNAGFEEKEYLRLTDLPVGTRFLSHGSWFDLMEHRRTRSLCRLVGKNKLYLISRLSLVEKLENK